MTTLNSGDDITRSAPWIALVRRCRSVLPGKRLTLTEYECRVIDRAFIYTGKLSISGIDTLLRDVGIKGVALCTYADKHQMPEFIMPEKVEPTDDAIATWENMRKHDPVTTWKNMRKHDAEWYVPLGEEILRLNNALTAIRALHPGDVYTFDQEFVRLLNEIVGPKWLHESGKALGPDFTIARVNDLISVHRVAGLKLDIQDFQKAIDTDTEHWRAMAQSIGLAPRPTVPVDHLPEHPAPTIRSLLDSTERARVAAEVFDAVHRSQSERLNSPPPRYAPWPLSSYPLVPWYKKQPHWMLMMITGAVCMFVLLACAGLLR